MNARITPSLPRGTVTAPPSKSYAHRLLICAMLAGGGKVCNIDLSDDIRATLRCMSSLGVRYEYRDRVITVLNGIAPEKREITLDVGESGSTLRFFIPICLILGGRFVFNGAKRLFERPLGVYEEICGKNGIKFDLSEDSLAVEGRLSARHIAVRGDISSQFVSDLLFASSLADEPVHIAVTGRIESAPYIDMTVSSLAYHGITFEKRGCVFTRRGGSAVQKVTSAEGDWSNAAYLLAFNYIGGSVRVTDLDENSLQGDKVCLELFGSLVSGRPVISVADCPDLFPALAAVAALNNGAEFTHTSRLSAKESDRVRAMADTLRAFGIESEVFPDNAVIFTAEPHAPGRALPCFNDHRIVMAQTLIMSVCGGDIAGVQAINKSFPDYFKTFRSLGGIVDFYED